LKKYNKFKEKVPVVAVPTTYNSITEDELKANGVSICIYANQMLRAAYPSMVSVAQSILKHGRSQEADGTLMPVKDIITLIDDGNGQKMSPAGAMTELVRDFLTPGALFEVLRDSGVTFYAGVPDSLLKDFGAYVYDHAEQVITANEGSAIALAAGYHLATGKIPMVYLQNSGLGNAINPLLSLADPKVYGTPMLLLIGWRGQPAKKDEPQHMVQGARMRAMLDAMKIPHAVMPDYLENGGGAKEVVQTAVETAKRTSQPYALLVKRQTFSNYESRNPCIKLVPLLREQALRACILRLGERDVVIGTTGFTSREIYTIREELGQDHSKDFLTVGSMGHASAIALGIALQEKDRNVVCFDGDGAMIMHMGNMVTIGSLGPTNFKHVVINNGVHDSVGGQPTGMKDGTIVPVAKALSYRWAKCVSTEEDLAVAFDELLKAEGPGLLEVETRPGARGDLGRPKTSPTSNKKALMSFLSSS
jgi:phosphonopyruvate decarboxylase